MKTTRQRAAYVSRSALTIVELLVIICIINILLGLLLPAVEAAQEAARQARCQNNLKQMAVAVLLHESSLGHFPTGGWGNQWVGEPDRGFGIEQPGGWIFNTLPYLEESHVHEHGRLATGEAKRVAARQMLGHPLPVFNCPSRRAPKLYKYDIGLTLRNADMSEFVAKSDYAVCGGDLALVGGGGPASDEPHDLQTYNWPSHDKFTGIAFVRSLVRMQQITDGSSSTYLAGEKLFNGPAVGDDQVLYLGDDADVRRWTDRPPVRDGQNSDAWFHWFGSAHPTKCFFAYCDGSVRSVGYEIDPEIHRLLGNRQDGLIVNPSETVR